MDTVDILHENLCIRKIITVIKGENPHHHKLLSVNGRHSDAFVYVISGSCTYRFDGKSEFTANAGDVFYLPHKSVYTMYIHTTDYKFIFCDFEFAEDIPRCAALYSAARERNADSLFVKLLARYHAPENTYAECMAVLYSIYSALLRNAEKEYLGKSKEEYAKEAKRHMDECFKNAAFGVASVAEKIGISEVYLRRLFKAQFGISPSKYLILVRLKNAKELMKYPFLNLEDCALQSGFSSLQYFCRLFKKETGISPGKYKSGL
jgi:AraC-like DNA-binding protein